MSEAYYILQVRSAQGETTSERVESERAVIGRREGDIIIDDTGASGRHAELIVGEDSVTVRDLGSTNGVVWRGAIVREAFNVALGETFQIGRTTFTLAAIEAARSGEKEGEEKTAFMTAAELGMVEAPSEAPREATPGPLRTEESTPRPSTADAPTAPDSGSPSASTDEEEEATAWMSAMEGEGPMSSGDWRDEAAPSAETGGATSSSTPSSAVEPGPLALSDATAKEVINIHERRPNFQGRGDELLKLFVGHGLLVLFTFGIYTPWFLCKLLEYLASRTVFGPTQSGWVYVRFEGKGGALFVKFIVGYLLTLLTVGIYGAWFLCDLARWFLEHTEGVAEDGAVFRARFTMTGSELLFTFFTQYLLAFVTLGIYGAWAYCKVRAALMDKVTLYEDGEVVGGVCFIGSGGTLFPLAVIQVLLCLVTLGVYVPWAAVRFTQYMQRHTRVHYRERWFQGDFTGEGGPYFVLNVVGLLLTQLTLGIYGAWYYAKKRAYDTNHQVWYELG